MKDESVISTPLIAWGVASRPLPGQVACGDLHLIEPIMDGALMAVVDGLGHGDEAAAAAQKAIAVLESHAEEPPAALVKRCHEALTQTRGAVMTVATLREDKLACLGVGNVESVLLRADRQAKAPSYRVLLRSGVVGCQLPDLRASVVPLAPHDLLIVATDGLDAGFAEGLAPSGSPQQLADRILERHFKGHDDALVLVVRYLGTQHADPLARR